MAEGPKEVEEFLEEVLTDPEAKASYEDSMGRHRLIDALVATRKQLGLTQVEVAKSMGVGQSTVSQFESEGSDPRVSTIQRYARALGLQLIITPTEYSVKL